MRYEDIISSLSEYENGDIVILNARSLDESGYIVFDRNDPDRDYEVYDTFEEAKDELECGLEL